MSDPRITDEAVEAAAKAVSLDWQNFVASMRLALEAALPHLVPQPVVDREALIASCPSCQHEWREHDKSDGCSHGWEYNLDGSFATEGCGCFLAHVRKSA